MRMIRLLSFLCLLCLHFAHSKLSVPLVTWSGNAKADALPTYVTYGQTVQLTQIFNQLVKPAIESKSLVLLFLQDELSNDDFTKYSTSFTHLQKMMESKKYEFFPSVAREKALNALLHADDVEYVGSSSLSDWKYNGDKHIVAFNLEPVSGSSSQGRGDILKRNDHMIHLITKTLRQHGTKFNAVFTAEEPSQLVANFLSNEEIADATFGSRHLLADDGKNKSRNFFNGTCVLLYVKSIKFEIAGELEPFELITPETHWEAAKGCGASGVASCISIETKTGSPESKNRSIADIKLNMMFKNTTHEWYCEDIEFMYTKKNDTNATVINFPCNGGNSSFASDVFNSIAAPKGMSFGCHGLTFTKGNSTLKLGGFQVQSSCRNIYNFLGEYNCVGFFTIPILTGIFVTVILMMGLYMGIMMMMAIQVQDRYDDPKGKTISVTTTHNE